MISCVVTHASSFVFYSFINWEPVELLEERCAVLMAWSSENEACSSIFGLSASVELQS